MKVGGVSLTLLPAFGIPFLLMGSLSNLDMNVSVQSFCILLGHVGGYYLGSLLFFLFIFYFLIFFLTRDLGEKESRGRDWEEWKEVKLWLVCYA